MALLSIQTLLDLLNTEYLTPSFDPIAFIDILTILNCTYVGNAHTPRTHTGTSPYLIPPKTSGLREDVFIVLALDSDREGAASVLKIEDPTISPPTTDAPGSPSPFPPSQIFRNINIYAVNKPMTNY